MAGTIRLSDTEACSDLALLERVAAGIRALGTDVVPGPPTAGDREYICRELGRAVERLRCAGIDVARYAG